MNLIKILGYSQSNADELKKYEEENQIRIPIIFIDFFSYASGVVTFGIRMSDLEKENPPAHLENKDYSINEFGIPCCPNNPSLPMKPEGKSKLRSGVERYKFVCPKMTFDKCEDGKYRRFCHCENPCTSSRCGRMVYLYPEKDLRAYPGTLRGTALWDSTYKIRTAVERSISHFKDSFGLAGRKTQNEKTLHADLILAGITQLITVVLADKIHRHKYIRSLKPLIT